MFLGCSSAEPRREGERGSKMSKPQRVLKARRITAWVFQPQVPMLICFGRAEGTQVGGAGILTPNLRVRATLRPCSDPSWDLHVTGAPFRCCG
jgi:hypothetical protein